MWRINDSGGIFLKVHLQLNNTKKEVKMQDDKLMTSAEVAKYLKVGRNTAYAILRSPDLAVLKLGRLTRVLKSSLDLWITEHTQTKGA